MTDTAFDRWCAACLEPVELCDEALCSECGERHARVYDRAEGFCLRCRGGCESCGCAVLVGERLCSDCERDVLSSNVLAPVRLPSLGLA